MGLGCVVFSVRTRMPITMAWSTPGAALLAATAIPAELAAAMLLSLIHI